MRGREMKSKGKGGREDEGNTKKGPNFMQFFALLISTILQMKDSTH